MTRIPRHHVISLLIAQHVFGYQWGMCLSSDDITFTDNPDSVQFSRAPKCFFPVNEDVVDHILPDHTYSTDISQAFRALGFMSSMDWGCYVGSSGGNVTTLSLVPPANLPQNSPYCIFMKGYISQVGPVAICEGILEAMGVQIPPTDPNSISVGDRLDRDRTEGYDIMAQGFADRTTLLSRIGVPAENRPDNYDFSPDVPTQEPKEVDNE